MSVSLLDPGRKQVSELLGLMPCPDQLHGRSLWPSGILDIPVLEGRLHRYPAFCMPTNESGPCRQVCIASVMADVWPPALPEPEALTSGINQKESWNNLKLNLVQIKIGAVAKTNTNLKLRTTMWKAWQDSNVLFKLIRTKFRQPR